MNNPTAPAPALLAAIAAFDDTEREPVQAWGKTFYIGIMDEAAYQSWMSLKDRLQPGTCRAILVAHCLTDEEGNRVFTNEQIPALRRKSAKTVERLFYLARDKNDLSPEKKTLEPTQT